MLMPSPRNCIWSAAGAGVCALVLAAYLAVRGEQGIWETLEFWDLILLTAAIVAAAILAGVLVIRQAQRQTVEQLAAQLEAFREKPIPHTDTLRGSDLDTAADLAPLVEAIDLLSRSYRQVLSDRVKQNEALEALRSMLGRVEEVSAGSMPGLSFRSNVSSRDMVARLTPTLHWLTATPTLQSFLGCPISRLNGRPFVEVVHPEDVGKVRRAFQKALQTGEAHNLVFRVQPCLPEEENRQTILEQEGNARVMVRPAVQERHVEMDVMTRYNEVGEPLHLRCYLVDISDRVRAEAQVRRRSQELAVTNERLRRINQDLQRLKESYRDLYHNAPVMYFSLDSAGRFVAFNDTMLWALGYARDDLFRRPYTCLLTPESQQQFQAKPDAFQHAGEVETRWVKKDGTIIDVWIRSTPLLDANGAFVRSRSVAQDVTERNRLAAELRHRGDELERANARLVQINKALDEFTAVVSHDLKEPLRTIEGYSTFLAQEYADKLGPQETDHIAHLVQASRRLANLIDDLLTLAQAGRVLRDPQVFDLREVVSTVCRDLDHLIKRRNGRVVIEGELPWVLGDPTRVAQLLSNLIANGLKYNKSDRPQVRIGIHPPADDTVAASSSGNEGESGGISQSLVTLRVADNGIGIDPRYHEEIFAIFRRLHTPGKYEGTGAGLAIARKIVEAHGGRIWVESQPGQGASFFFTLPRADTPTSLPLSPGNGLPATTSIRSEGTPAPSLHPTFDKGGRGMPALRAPAPVTQKILMAPSSSPFTQPGSVPPPPSTPQPSGVKNANTVTVANSTEQAAPTALKPPSGKGKAEMPPRSARILLVEDMPEIALITQRIGQRAGHEMIWLPSAEVAWDHLQKPENRPDLVLLDIHLPGMTGLDLCKKLRATPGLSDLTIALFSQLDQPEAVAAGQSAGANYVLSKDLLCIAGAWQRQIGDILAGRKSSLV